MKIPIITHGHYIHSLRASNQLRRVAVAFAELIDNSIDAGAKTIQLTFEPEAKLARIADDGRGCNDLRRFFDLGASASNDAGDRLGRYGVGGTQAAASLCDSEEVISISGGHRYVASAEWSRMAEENLTLEFQANKPLPTRSPSGTAITLAGFRWMDGRWARRERDAREHWSRIYAPAILGGLVLMVNGEKLSPRPLPALESKRVETGSIAGKRYRATVGILKDEREATDADWSAGFYVACAGRLMFERPIWDGADEYGGAPIFVYVELIEQGASEKWLLDTHKVDFAEREALFADLVPRITDLLDAANDRGKDIELRVIEEELSALLAKALDGKSAYDRIREKRRSPENSTGTVEPTDTKKGRENAVNSDPQKPGSVIEFPKAPRRDESWRLQFGHLGEKAGIGKAGANDKTAWMKFNLDNEFVNANRRSNSLIPLGLASIWESADERRRKRLWGAVFGETLQLEIPPDEQYPYWMAEVLNRVQRQQLPRGRADEARAKGIRT